MEVWFEEFSRQNPKLVYYMVLLATLLWRYRRFIVQFVFLFDIKCLDPKDNVSVVRWLAALGFNFSRMPKTETLEWLSETRDFWGDGAYLDPFVDFGRDGAQDWSDLKTIFSRKHQIQVAALHSASWLHPLNDLEVECAFNIYRNMKKIVVSLNDTNFFSENKAFNATIAGIKLCKMGPPNSEENPIHSMLRGITDSTLNPSFLTGAERNSQSFLAFKTRVTEFHGWCSTINTEEELLAGINNHNESVINWESNLLAVQYHHEIDQETLRGKHSVIPLWVSQYKDTVRQAKDKLNSAKNITTVGNQIFFE